MILFFILLNGFLYASGRNVVYKSTAPRRKPVIGASAVSPSTGTLSNVSAILDPIITILCNCITIVVKYYGGVYRIMRKEKISSS